MSVMATRITVAHMFPVKRALVLLLTGTLILLSSVQVVLIGEGEPGFYHTLITQVLMGVALVVPAGFIMTRLPPRGRPRVPLAIRTIVACFAWRLLMGLPLLFGGGGGYGVVIAKLLAGYWLAGWFVLAYLWYATDGRKIEAEIVGAGAVGG